jgi:uncharacterized membrane protein (DUF485 family)
MANPTTRSHNISLITLFLWVGFVCSISFMEAWLKFRAPGVTLAIGLGIGKVIFSALNKIEWVFASVFLGCLFFDKRRLGLFVIPFLCLLVQTFFLFPALINRAEIVQSGGV